MTLVHIIGGGLAGLAAGLALSQTGRRVVVYEQAPDCGGRCRSYFDRELGCRIDNGNHLLLSGNRAAMRYLDMLGTRQTLGGPDAPVFPFIDLRDGQRWTLRPNTGRVPWWLLIASRRVPGAGLRDFARLLALRRATADATVGGSLRHDALYERLIEPLAVSALNTPADQGSAQLFWAVMAESLMRGGAHCVPLFPRDGLSESFIDPAVARIAALGGEVRTRARIGELTIEGGRVAALGGPDGAIDLAPSDLVVLATPAAVAATLLPGLVVPDAHEAIVNLHYRYDADPGEAGFVGLIGGLAEWIFVKRGVVSVTISAANRLLDRPGDELAPLVWSEIKQALGLVAGMPPWRMIRERRATFAATPAQHRRRSHATTYLSNLVLAGDWTHTGLPATIEGAIRSGFAAAQHVTGNLRGA